MTCHQHGAHNAHLINATAWRRDVRPPTVPRWAVWLGLAVVLGLMIGGRW
jgi:hypothetical protein